MLFGWLITDEMDDARRPDRLYECRNGPLIVRNTCRGCHSEVLRCGGPQYRVRGHRVPAARSHSFRDGGLRPLGLSSDLALREIPTANPELWGSGELWDARSRARDPLAVDASERSGGQTVQED